MTDITNVSTSVVKPSVRGTASSPQVQRSAQAGYAQADDVTRRANVLSDIDTPQNIAALNRLEKVLASDKPLRTDVPRGYYLDLKV
ncbi:MAG: hypothetical protein HQL36_11060 [Alphaproteobacteria bacterium]|nr:hypothetical protein [Alphaproteobacteria bacterium]MBF0251690.1 hypothetical protein [Alphaproteobacteria bacterium]